MAEHDFISSYRFEVAVTPALSDGGARWTASASFSEVNGLEIDIEKKEIREGGYNRGMRQLAGKTSHPALVLKRGATLDQGFWTWLQACFAASYPLPYVHGTIKVYEPGPFEATADSPDVISARRYAQWEFINGLATKVKMADLKGVSASDVPIEELHLVHEGLFRVAPS